MTAFKSNEETIRQADEDNKLPAKSRHGRVRMAYFSYTTPTATVAVNDTIDLCQIPAGARILGGRIDFEAMSSGGGTAKLQIGTAADPDKFLGSTSVDSAGQTDFANTFALGMGSLHDGSVIQAVNPDDTSEAWAADKDLYGYIEYVLD